MAVTILFKNPRPALPVPDQLDRLAHDLAAESAETRAHLAARRVSLILQCLEAGQ